MDPLTAAAASGIRSRMEALDLLANNIANSSAPAFKADREFYDLYLSAEGAGSPDGGLSSLLPVIGRQWTDFSQGSLTPTENPLDLALAGSGFFVATSAAGPLLTRVGAFRISPQGDLQTREGWNVRGKDGRAIRLDASRPVEVTLDGVVRQDGQEIARLDLVDVPDSAALKKRGQNYFEFSSSGVSPIPVQPQVQQGKLEAGNVQPAEAAVRLVAVTRQFEMLQRALSVGVEMNRQAVEEVAKVI